MALTKEAIQHIQETSIKPEDRLVQSDGRTFIVNEHGEGAEIKRRPVVGFEVNTLTALVDYIKNMDYQAENKLYLNIETPTRVGLYSELQSNNERDLIAAVKAITPEMNFGYFSDAEDLIIELQAKFLPTDDLTTLLRVLGNLQEENVKNYGDDGVSQQVTIKKGITTVTNVVVPNPVTLAPFRTFHEVAQPESPFIFRMKEGGRGALFEADGQGWKLAAIQNIKAFFEAQLAGMDNIVILA